MQRKTRFALRRGGYGIWLLGLSLVVAAPHAAVSQQLIDGIAAIVNDNIITISEVREAMAFEAVELDKRYYGTELDLRRRELFRKTLQPLIDVEIQLERAKALNVTVTDQAVDRQVNQVKQENQLGDAQFEEILQSRGLTMEAYRENIRRSLLLSKLVTAEVRSRLVVTEEELRKAYEQQKERFSIAGELTVSHILFLAPEGATSEEETQARQKADAILQQLRAGGDFAALARQHSEGPSAENAGLLGTFRTGELLPGFEEAIADLQPGDISEPVRTQIGWHIIRLESAEAGGYQPLEAVSEELSSEIMRTQSEQKYKEWIESLRQQAYIKILHEG